MGSRSRLRLLLDTHVWLWSHLEPTRLGRKLGAALEDRANELWLSPISLWETLVLAERRRVELAPNADAWIRHALATAPLRDAPLTREVALASRSLDLDHQDPADRFIAASAAVHGLTLATADARLRRSALYDVLPASGA